MRDGIWRQMINELTEIYLKDTRFKTRLSKEEAEKYFRCLLERGNLYLSVKDERLDGYVEFFCINEEQLKRIVGGGEFHIGDENITDGRWCYISDVWISPEKRGREVWKELKRGLMERTKHCIAYIGEKQKHNDMLVIRRRHG